MKGAAPPQEGAKFRMFLAIAAVMGGLGALVALTFHPVPEGNREPLMLAIGIVLGWGSTVINSEFGSSPGGRKAADMALKRLDDGDEVKRGRSNVRP